MKNFFFILGLTSFWVFNFNISFAQNSSLVFFTQGSEPFYVFLNGIKQNSNIGNNIKIFALEENKYNVLIIIPPPAFSMVNNFLKISAGKESVYSIVKNMKGDYELIPKGENQLSFSQSAPNQQVIKFNSRLTAASPMPLGIGAGMNTVTGNSGQTAATYPANNMDIYSGNQSGSPSPVYLQGYDGPVGCPAPMSAQEFQYVKNTINSKPFESGKITIAKQVSGSKCLFSSQVKEIMLLFSFEGTKIEFAKFAYEHTYDKGNYFIVNEAFEFDSSIDELNRFVGK